MAQIRGISQRPLKSFWSCIWTTSKRENYLASVMGLRCAREHFILEVIPGMTNPKVIGTKSGHINGRGTFTHSEKLRRNILRRVAPRQPVWFNRSGFLFNARWRIRDRCLKGWKNFCGKPFCLVFYLENRKPSLQL